MVYYLYDASGKTQSQPDSKTIASIRTVIDAAGTLPPPSGLIGGVGISATDHEVVTLSGILTGPRTLNGTGTTHYDIPPYANSTHLLMDAASVTSNVVLPATGSTSVWPLSGTITSDIITSGATAGSSGTVTTHAVITFNGTRFANAVVSSGGVSKTCTIDLGGLSAGAC
jgi:hypothetical protein